MGAPYGSCNSMHTSRFLAARAANNPSHYSDGVMHLSEMASRAAGGGGGSGLRTA